MSFQKKKEILSVRLFREFYSISESPLRQGLFATLDYRDLSIKIYNI